MDAADSVSQVQSQTTANSTAAYSTAIPPIPHRRPRVREISSRFMSSLASPSPSPSSSISYTPCASQHRAKSPTPKYGVSTPLPSAAFHSNQHQRSNSAQRSRGGGGEPDLLRCSDENVKESVIRSLEAQLRINPSKQQQVTSLQQQQQQQRKPRIASSSVKLPKDKENVGKSPDHESSRRSLESQIESVGSKVRNGTFGLSKRPDTPVPTGGSATERIVSSRYRLCSRSLDRSLSGRAPAPVSSAANLLRSSGMSMSSSVSTNDFSSSGYTSASETCDGDDDDDDDDDHSTATLSEPNTPRSQTDHRDSSKSLLAPSGSSSINLSSLSKFERPLLHQSIRHLEDGSSKAGNTCLPPLPCLKQQQVEAAADVRKSRMNLQQQKVDRHSLKLLHNHYMKWRFVNAKSKASMIAEKKEAENKLYSLGCMTAELRESVQRKRIELELLKMKNTIKTILKDQMPYLDEWSELEGEYSSSLSDVTKALVNASIQLPLGGNVHVDTKEVGEALGSAIKMMESISCNINGFIERAEETDVYGSEVARMVGGERALVEECKELLYKTHASQVEECSLRGQLMQLQKR
ncbi:protein ENDOSPERM DEFECTIVE 1-like [Impatiens glandulifera]|uniref:protein ENDOSPERM DEFECTIVE 1-like n=1 Tax=Impatiens glandulifera TaxID=253017 RepID=UPI001FB19145|nr:protein ENDOSPERM DEFECTIVE 1-like [Impatiens glandulifera]